MGSSSSDHCPTESTSNNPRSRSSSAVSATARGSAAAALRRPHEGAYPGAMLQVDEPGALPLSPSSTHWTRGLEETQLLLNEPLHG